MKMNLIQRIKKAWRVLRGESGESTPDKVFVDVLGVATESMQKNSDAITVLEKLLHETQTEHLKIMNDFFHTVVKRIMPEYLFDLYKDTQQKIPGLDMNIANSFDLQDSVCGREITIHYRGVLVGEMTIKTRRNDVDLPVTTCTINFLYEQEQAKTEA